MPTASLLAAPGQGDSNALDDIVERLRSDARFDGVLLFGSLAREELSACSDIDLIAVHHGSVPDDVLVGLSPRLSVAFYTPQRLSRLPENSPLFANHLAREGIVLHDRTGALSGTLARVEPVSTTAADRLAALTERRCADVLSDPGFAPSDRLSAAELYALTKQVALLESARRDTYEFDRHRAIKSLGESDPSLRRDIENAAALEPAWLARRCTPPSPVPVALSAALVRSVTRIVEAARSR
jgi:predicted nucleotidyltransferase